MNNFWANLWGRKSTFPDSEFYEKIVNIPRNGEWRDDYNLEKYLRVAKILREKGLPDEFIINSLNTLYIASSREQTLNLPYKQYSQQDIQDLLELGRTIAPDE